MRYHLSRLSHTLGDVLPMWPSAIGVALYEGALPRPALEPLVSVAEVLLRGVWRPQLLRGPLAGARQRRGAFEGLPRRCEQLVHTSAHELAPYKLPP